MQFRNTEDQNMIIKIYDSIAGDTGAVIELEPAGAPYEDEIVDNDENKFAAIKALQATIRFNSKQAITLGNFTRDGILYDDRFYVTVECGEENRFVFKGFLLLDDMKEPYLDPSNEVVLKATDRLGTLKETALVDTNDSNPKNEHKIITYIVWCLRKTGLSLPINIISNIKHEYGAGHWMNAIYLDAKTFEKEIGTSVNCYEVLKSLLGYHAFITQDKGEWWIVNVDEYAEHPIYVNRYQADGTYDGEQPATVYNKSIAAANSIKLTNRGTSVTLARPKEFCKLTYKYDYAKELICNINLVRGAYIADIDLDSKKYQVECWNLKRGFPTSPQATTITPYIQRNFDANGIEDERYLVIPNAASPAYREYLESESIPVYAKDKFRFSCDWRLQTNTGFASQFLFFSLLVLHGDDGKWYVLGYRDNLFGDLGSSDFKWYDTANFTANTAAGWSRVQWNQIEETEWQSQSWTAPPMPVNGKLYIWLNNFKQDFEADYNKVIEYSNLSFEYIAYINGTYQKYVSRYDKFTQPTPDGQLLSNIDDEVKVSDSDNRNFKGTLLWHNGTTYLPTGRFYNNALYHDVPIPGSVPKYPFGKMQALSVMNQNRNLNRLLRVQAIGINSSDDDGFDRCNAISLIHKYSFGYPSEHTVNKYFMLLNMKRDWKRCTWSGTVAEVYDTTIGKVFTDEYERKYLTATEQ